MEKKYLGMTVNERLYVGGLVDKFYESVREKNIEKVKSILKEVEVTDDKSINDILKSLGLQ